MTSQAAYPALVLNADFRPLSHFPLSVWSWQDALKAVFQDRVYPVDYYDAEVHTPNLSFKLPSVIALKQYIPQHHTPAFTRHNLYLRDEYKCQYCSQELRSHELTFDHVVPRSRGGILSFENTVAACVDCNSMKANRTPEEAGMKLMRPPHVPSYQELASIQARLRPMPLHESWLDFLYWDGPLQTT